MPTIKQRLSMVRAALLPTWGGKTQQVDGKSNNYVRNLSRYIAPNQLARMKQDIQTWREAGSEMEQAWYPNRVKTQRIYMDTVLNGQVSACMDRREKLTTLKKYRIVNKNTRVEDEEASKIIKKKWFRKLMKYHVESKAFGYSLVYLDDLVDGNFPKMSIVRRHNVSPDRLNVTQYVYSLSGAPFMEEPYVDWHCWMPTPTDLGISNCGYGYLYKVAPYEIFMRNVLSQNIDATENFGMPTRVGKTNKAAESEERGIFEQALAEMGSAGYILMDTIGDTIELMESKSLGNGYKIYESLDARLQKIISKIILGHSDALDSVPGKLGNDSEESPAQKAMNDVATVDMDDFTDYCNNELLPKLINLGFPFNDTHEFEFDNNEETEEALEKEDESNLRLATIFKMVKDAGGENDWPAFEKRTGWKVEKAEVPVPLMPGAPGAPKPNGTKPAEVAPPAKKKTDVKARLEEIYGSHTHEENE